MGLEIIKDADWGYATRNEMGINIQAIWDYCQKFENPIGAFIHYYLQTFLHESGHQVLFELMDDDKINCDNFMIGAEKVLYFLLGDKWTKEDEEYYKNDEVYKNGKT